jgi:2,4-dienoyl-CoA reductase-like NADH-dependent reductase (Old Yellow Enzyme family)
MLLQSLLAVAPNYFAILRHFFLDMTLAPFGSVPIFYGSKPYETPRALSVHGIRATVADYRQAAVNAKEAGFSRV